MSTPEAQTSAYNELTERLKRPMDLANLRGIFTIIARFHFSDARNYGSSSADLAGLVYDFSRPGSSDILDVSATWASPASNESQRPAVFIALPKINYKKSGLGDFVDNSDDDAGTTRGVSAEATMVWRFYHPSIDISFLLADTAVNFLLAAKEVLMRQIGLTHIDVQAVQEDKVEQSKPNAIHVVDMIVSLGYVHESSVILQSHVLAQIALELKAVS